MKLNGVMLNSSDPKKLGEFYSKFLGKPGWQDGEWYGFDVDGGMLMIGPHSEVKGENKEPGRHMISFVSGDVKTEFERIVKASDAKVIAEPYQPDKENNSKVWLATLADPDGNYFQLSTPWE